MVGKGRTYQGRKIEVRIPDELLALIDAYADTNGLSRPELIRRLLQKALS